MTAPLDDPRIDQLCSLIKDSFRVHPNQDPIYVDVSGHVGRLASRQHQVVFGRRGSGKSCLLVHYHRTVARKAKVLTVYVNADEVKTLQYPDLLIRLLLSTGEAIQSARRGWRRIWRQRSEWLQRELGVLRALLDEADIARVTSEVSVTSSSSVSASVGTDVGGLGAGLSSGEAARRKADFTTKKIDTLERHLPDYKAALVDAFQKTGFKHAAIIVDDFYLIPPARQPDVIDYLHRLFRGTDLYLKIGTVRHRTALVRYDAGQTIGVEVAQDVEEINLDQTLEDMDSTKRYLAEMLDSMARKVGMEPLSDTHFSDEGLLALTLASGGVPRDFLNIFVEAIGAARDISATHRLTPRTVYKGAGRVSYRTKLINLRIDAGAEASGLETVFRDLTTYCLKEKRKTAFLISQDDAAKYRSEHELIQQLMDFKLIHVIEPDTSAASGRPGRHEAYTLDFALFMEPRLRHIDHAEFWKVDEQRRRRGLREAPVYSLERAKKVLENGDKEGTEKAIEDIQTDVGIEEPSAAELAEE